MSDPPNYSKRIKRADLKIAIIRLASKDFDDLSYNDLVMVFADLITSCLRWKKRFLKEADR